MSAGHICLFLTFSTTAPHAMIAETFGTITSNQWFATVLPLLIKHNVLDLVVLWKQPYGSINPA